MRLAAALLLARDSAGARLGIVMDPSAQRTAEDEADFFRRLEVEHRVDAYYIVLPARAKVLGTVFEGGMLVRDFQFGRNPSIVLFIERPLVAHDGQGNYDFVAKGKRTRYLRSLVARAQHVEVWEGVDELLDSLVGLVDAGP